MSFLNWFKKSKYAIPILLVLIVIVGIGVYLLSSTIQNCSGASDGKCVRFGNSSEGSLAIHVSNGQLVDGSGKAIRLLGVDAAGTETSCMSNGFSTGPLSSSEAEGMASWHIKIVRIPLNEDCWLGINGVPAAYSGTNYINAIENWVTNLNNAGIVVILDLHRAAPGTYQPTGQWPMADEDYSPNFWTSVASTFKSNPAIIFDLYNEPYLGGPTPSSSDWSCWLNGCTNTTSVSGLGPETYHTAGMQQLVNAVRATGATQPILIAGLHNSGDPCGLHDSDYMAGNCIEINNMPKDPLNQLIIDFHNYNNPGSSCTSATCWNIVAQAAKTADIPIITDEFGEKDCSAVYMNTYMNWADQNNISYLAWTWNVNTKTSCDSNIHTPSNDSSNHFLVSDWTGTPTTISPDGAAYQAHLAIPAVYGSE